MELYDKTAQELARITMRRYSTSFSSSTFLFPKALRGHIYNIYGLVRIADEVVDSYGKVDALRVLNDLEKETYEAIKRHYSTNPIIHAFALTANQYSLDSAVIAAFFKSMRMDASPLTYTDGLYTDYIYGSAEAIGLLCLPVFCRGDKKLFNKLSGGARRLGAAYQKVNFLRDLKADYEDLGRIYFPGITYDTFSETDKQLIIADIKADFAVALPTIYQLPKDIQPAVLVSYYYYSALLKKLSSTTVATIKTRRVRIAGIHKLTLFARGLFGRRISS